MLWPKRWSKIWKCGISSYRVNDSWNINIEINILMYLCHRNRGPQKIVTGIWPCWSQSQSAMWTWCSSRRGQAFKQVLDSAFMRLDSISSTLVKFIIQPKILRGKTSTSISSFQEPLTSSTAHRHHPWPLEISMLFPNASDTINHISTIYQEPLRIA